MRSTAIIKNFKPARHLIGIQLPTNQDGHAGREVEKILEGMGVPINRGAGPDILQFGLEIKTRKLSATSAQTITAMHPDNIINTSYFDSPVYEKIRQQLRVYTNDSNVIVKAEVFNFDQPQIQELLEEAYEHGRKIITGNPNIGYTPYSKQWGFFEQTRKDRPEYDFRVTNTMMEGLEAMSKSTFRNIFEVAE
jgi:hypothetical protein